jgi:hypothetical protein
MPKGAVLIQSCFGGLRENRGANAGRLFCHLIKELLVPCIPCRQIPIDRLCKGLQDPFDAVVKTVQVEGYAPEVVVVKESLFPAPEGEVSDPLDFVYVLPYSPG